MKRTEIFDGAKYILDKGYQMHCSKVLNDDKVRRNQLNRLKIPYHTRMLKFRYKKINQGIFATDPRFLLVPVPGRN